VRSSRKNEEAVISSTGISQSPMALTSPNDSVPRNQTKHI
jgi:hypothetical protein